MSCAELKRQVYRGCLTGTLETTLRSMLDYPQAEQWANRFMQDDVGTFVPSLGLGRRLNNFKVGSDPEFAFFSRSRKRAAFADCGLHVGLAAGSDQNERLAELRPWPSASVVEHVASILTELRWMFRIYPATRVYGWRAGAFYQGDGLGGHVHFGRKTSIKDREIMGLDSIALALAALGIFPLDEWARRKDGDSLGQVYGAFSDTRVQAHGYEYRSMPSWMHSPKAAFIVITACKLAMFDPELVIPWLDSPEDALSHLKMLAKYYRYRDDDAWILYKLLCDSKSIPRATDRDFKPAWGFPTDVVLPDLTNYILPSSIPPQTSEVEEIFRYLVEDVPLTFRELPPNFVATIPPGYIWAPSLIPCGRRAGVGDVIHDLVIHSEQPVEFRFPRESGKLSVSQALYANWTSKQRQLFRTTYRGVVEGNRARSVVIPHQWRQALHIKTLRTFLYDEGFFPFWRVPEVKPDSFALWTQFLNSQSKKETKVRTL